MSSGIKLTYEEVRKYFEEQGCELLEQEYKNARTKMKYRCSCGNEHEVRWYRFVVGDRCRQCFRRRLAESQFFDQETAERKFKECGCELLEQYNGSRVKVKYKCECGQVSEATPNNVWRGGRCLACGTAKRSGPNHYDWRDDRVLANLNDTFRQKSYKLIAMVLKVTGRVKNERSAKLLGYDYKQLQEHITSHPNWEKVRAGNWHVDHVFPIKAFLDYGVQT